MLYHLIQKGIAMTDTVRQLMTSNVTTLDINENLMTAKAIMQRGHMRHLPVVDNGKLVGLITHRDLLRAQMDALAESTKSESPTLATLPAAERMRRNVITVNANDDPTRAARTMLQNKIGCLPVVEGDVLVGILTEADFVKWSLDRSA